MELALRTMLPGADGRVLCAPGGGGARCIGGNARAAVAVPLDGGAGHEQRCAGRNGCGGGGLCWASMVLLLLLLCIATERRSVLLRAARRRQRARRGAVAVCRQRVQIVLSPLLSIIDQITHPQL